MRRANFERLKGLIDRITLVNDELERYIVQAQAGRFNKANLSDVFEYMSEEASDRMFSVLAERLREGGRIAYWNLLAPRTPPLPLQGRLRPLTATASRLHGCDRTWFYRAFHVNEVQSA